MLQLLKIASTTPQYATTDYFYQQASLATILSGASYTFANWSTHTGGAATFATGLHYDLSINGVLQADGIYTVGSASVVLANTTTTAQTISAGTPLTLQAGTITPTTVAIP